MKTLEEKIAVMQAGVDRKTIQICTSRGWKDCIAPEGLSFNWAKYDYRIKPEPQKIWVNFYESSGITVGYAHSTKELALKNARGFCVPKCFVEVMEEDQED